MIKIVKWILAVTLLVGFTACTGKIKPPQEDVLTQTVLSKDKIIITVLVKYAFSINTFEKQVEEKFPQVDIIQVGNYTSDMGTNEYNARLAHGDLTDIVMTWPLEIGEEYWADQLMDLSSFPMSVKYNTAMLDSISRDGKLYYLPGPSQVRGIVYNKTLFKEKGWEVPADYNGFIELCRTIEKSGMRSLQLGFANPEVLDTAFVGYGYANSLSKPEDKQWLAEYNSGIGSIGEQLTPAFETFQELIDAGILQKNDLNVSYSDREQMLFTRKCAMTEDSVLLTRMGMQASGCTDEFGLMPFFNDAIDGDWARIYPVCYIGVNKKLTEEKNKEKYDKVMEIMEYISTNEGQVALAGDTGAMISSLNGVAPPNISEIKDLLPTLIHGRYTVFPTLKNAQSALREGLAGILLGTLTVSDVVTMVDKKNGTPDIETPEIILGSASKDFSILETGNFITDTMREKSGCEVALFLDGGKDGKYNGKGVGARLYEGNLTASDVKRIMPDLKYGEKCEIWKTTMTGENLIKTLEYSISVDNNRGGWFYYFSGLYVEYAPSAEPGKRIKKITDATGEAIDKTKLYTVAVMDESVSIENLTTCEETGESIPLLIENKIQQEKIISPSSDGRFVVCEP